MTTNAVTTIASRKTFDGIAVVVWSDGLVTGRVGERVCGVKLPLAVAFRAADDFGLYTWAELPAFVRSVVKAGKVPHRVRPTREQSEAIMQVNAARRMAAAKSAIENDRSFRGVGLRRLGY